MAEDECIAQCLAHVIFRCFLTAVVHITEKHVVERRESIIRYGRQLQDNLRLPDCIRVFAATDPGMPDGDIRIAAYVLGLCGFLAVVAGLYGLTSTIRDPLVLFPGIIGPGCAILLLWLGLALAKRRRVAQHSLATWQGHHVVSTSLNKEQMDPPANGRERDIDMQRSIQSIWTDAWIIL